MGVLKGKRERRSLSMLLDRNTRANFALHRVPTEFAELFIHCIPLKITSKRFMRSALQLYLITWRQYIRTENAVEIHHYDNFMIETVYAPSLSLLWELQVAIPGLCCPRGKHLSLDIFIRASQLTHENWKAFLFLLHPSKSQLTA